MFKLVYLRAPLLLTPGGRSQQAELACYWNVSLCWFAFLIKGDHQPQAEVRTQGFRPLTGHSHNDAKELQACFDVINSDWSLCCSVCLLLLARLLNMLNSKLHLTVVQ